MDYRRMKEKISKHIIRNVRPWFTVLVLTIPCIQGCKTLTLPSPIPPVLDNQRTFGSANHIEPQIGTNSGYCCTEIPPPGGSPTKDLYIFITYNALDEITIKETDSSLPSNCQNPLPLNPGDPNVPSPGVISLTGPQITFQRNQEAQGCPSYVETEALTPYGGGSTMESMFIIDNNIPSTVQGLTRTYSITATASTSSGTQVSSPLVVNFIFVTKPPNIVSFSAQGTLPNALPALMKFNVMDVKTVQIFQSGNLNPVYSITAPNVSGNFTENVWLPFSGNGNGNLNLIAWNAAGEETMMQTVVIGGIQLTQNPLCSTLQTYTYCVSCQSDIGTYNYQYTFGACSAQAADTYAQGLAGNCTVQAGLCPSP